MATGKQAFRGNTSPLLFDAILNRSPQPASQINPTLPPELDRIIAKALEKDRDARYRTAAEMRTDLKRVRKDTDSELTAAEQEPGYHSGESFFRYWFSIENRHWIFAGFLAVLLLVAAGVVLIQSGIFRPSPLSRADFQPKIRRPLSRLTLEPGLQADPTWSSDGQFIAYSSNRGGNFDIWVRPVEGGSPVQLTRDSAHEWQPDWSPKEDRIVYRSESDGGGLFVRRRYGGTAAKISSFGYRPLWSPDGARILFRSSFLGTFGPLEVYVISPDGGELREIVKEFLSEFTYVGDLAWHPDAERISFHGVHRREGTGFWTVSVEGPERGKIFL